MIVQTVFQEFQILTVPGGSKFYVWGLFHILLGFYQYHTYFNNPAILSFIKSNLTLVFYIFALFRFNYALTWRRGFHYLASNASSNLIWRSRID